MSRITQEQLQNFYASPEHQEQRYATYEQDFATLAGDGSLEYRELLDVLNSNAPYDKKRIAYEIIQNSFPNERAGVSAPQPSWWDSASTILGTAVDHYTAPVAKAFDDAAVAYQESGILTAAAKFVVSPHYGVSNFVNYVNPLKAGSEAADALMKQDFEAGNRLTTTYAGAAVARFGMDIVNTFVGGVASIIDLPLYAPAAIVTGLIVGAEDAFSTNADDVTWDKNYYPDLTENCPFYEGASGTAGMLGHVLRLSAKSVVAPYYSAAQTAQRTDDSSAIASYASNYWDFVGNDVAPLIGLDENDPDWISRGLRVGSTGLALALPGSEGGRAIIKDVVPKSVQSRAAQANEWAKADRFAPRRQTPEQIKAGQEAKSAAQAKAVADAKARAQKSDAAAKAKAETTGPNWLARVKAQLGSDAAKVEIAQAKVKAASESFTQAQSEPVVSANYKFGSVQAEDFSPRALALKALRAAEQELAIAQERAEFAKISFGQAIPSALTRAKAWWGDPAAKIEIAKAKVQAATQYLKIKQAESQSPDIHVLNEEIASDEAMSKMRVADKATARAVEILDQAQKELAAAEAAAPKPTPQPQQVAAPSFWTRIKAWQGIESAKIEIAEANLKTAKAKFDATLADVHKADADVKSKSSAVLSATDDAARARASQDLKAARKNRIAASSAHYDAILAETVAREDLTKLRDAPRLRAEAAAKAKAASAAAKAKADADAAKTKAADAAAKAAPSPAWTPKQQKVSAVPSENFRGNPSQDPIETQVYNINGKSTHVSARVTYGGPGSKYNNRICEDSLGMGTRPDGTTVAFVFDGAGGHSQGGYAATVTANESILHNAINNSLPIEEVVRQADKDVFDTHQHSSIGTVAAVEVSPSNNVTVVGVGDARALTIRNGEVHSAGNTTPHSLVQQWVDAGRITPEQAYTHPMNNVITSSVGTGPADLQLSVDSFQGQPGDLVVLASDGVFDIVTPYEIAELAKTHKTAAALQQAIFDLAYERNQTAAPFTILFDVDKPIEMEARGQKLDADGNLSAKGSGDNISVAVVELTNPKQTAGTEGAAAKKPQPAPKRSATPNIANDDPVNPVKPKPLPAIPAGAKVNSPLQNPDGTFDQVKLTSDGRGNLNVDTRNSQLTRTADPTQALKVLKARMQKNRPSISFDYNGRHYTYRFVADENVTHSAEVPFHYELDEN